MKALLTFCALVLLAGALSAQPVLDTLWTRAFPELGTSAFTDLCPSFDGGLVGTGWRIAGEDTFSQHKDMIVVQTDARGNTEWTFAIEGTAPDDTIWTGTSICQTEDSSYLILAQRRDHTKSVNEIVKVDRHGELVWQRAYNPFDFEIGMTIARTSDHAFIIATQAEIPDSEYCPWCALLQKIDSDGNLIWSHTYEDWCSWIVNRAIPSSDSGCVVVGYTDYPLVFKVDRDGNLLWQHEYYDQPIRYPIDMAETTDSYVVMGPSDTYGPASSYLFRIGFDGEPRNVVNFRVDGDRDENCHRIYRTPDGGFILGGNAMYDAGDRQPLLLIKAGADLFIQWRTVTDGENYMYGNAFCPLPDGKYALGGEAHTHGTGAFFGFAALYGPAANQVNVRSVVPSVLSLGQNYPNPFNPVTEIGFDLPRTMPVSLSVFDILGRQVTSLASGVLTSGHHVVGFDGSALPSGVYVYRLSTPGAVHNRKMLLLK